jgi:hypothetical protein
MGEVRGSELILFRWSGGVRENQDGGTYLFQKKRRREKRREERKEGPGGSP